METVISGVKACCTYGYYLTGLWKPCVKAGTIGVKMTRGHVCYVIWEKYVGGSGEFFGPPIGQPGAEPYAYDLPIPESCMVPFPLKDAIHAISKNSDAQAQCRMRKEELSSMSSDLIKKYDEWLGFVKGKEL